MSAPSTSGLSVELLLRVIDVKYGCFTLLYFYFSKVFNETVKQGIKKGSEKAITTALEKTGNYAANKAGEKIVELLSKKNKSAPIMVDTKTEIPGLSQYMFDERVNNLLSGGKLKRKVKFM